MFSHPITHISHSLGDKDDSRSYLASLAKAENQHMDKGLYGYMGSRWLHRGAIGGTLGLRVADHGDAVARGGVGTVVRCSGRW